MKLFRFVLTAYWNVKRRNKGIFDKCEILRSIYEVGEETNEMIRCFIEDSMKKQQSRHKTIAKLLLSYGQIICGLISFASERTISSKWNFG